MDASTSGPRVMVLAGGHDEQGRDAVGVWLAGATGVPLSGWVYPADQVRHHAATAGRLIATAEQSVLTGWQPDSTLELWERITRTVGRAGTPPPATRAGIVDVVTDIRRWRAACVSVVATRPDSDGRRRMAQPMWDTAVPDPRSEAALSAAAGVVPTGRCTVVDHALTVLGLLNWCSRVWQETERTRVGWPVLRQRFGPPRPAPPYWDRRLHAAGRPRTHR